MAIQKQIRNEYAAVFTYHRISDVEIFTVDGDVQLRIVTESYIDKEARKNGARAIKTENIIEHADFALTPFYALLKAKFPMFFEGTDDFDDDWKEKPVKKACFTQQTADGKLLQKWQEGLREPDFTEESEEE